MIFKTVPRTVVAYQTEDEKIFSDVKDATNHQNLLEFKNWYNDNKIYGRYGGCKIEFEEFVQWLKEHKDYINQFFPL